MPIAVNKSPVAASILLPRKVNCVDSSRDDDVDSSCEGDVEDLPEESDEGVDESAPTA